MEVGSRAAGARTVGALTGVLYVVLVFVGSAAVARTTGPGRHSLDASSADVTSYLADADTTRVWIGEYVGALGFALFLPFSASLVALGAATLVDDAWLERVARAAAAVYVALSVAAVAALAPALNRAGATAAAFLDLRTVLIALAFVFLAVWLLAAGAQALRARTLPQWLAWAAIVIGVLLVVTTPLAAYDPAFTGLPTFASFVWVLVASVLMWRRRASPATAAD